MELVYLWVEKYKNIENQGFNFSPRFNCKYDKDSNELIIDENKDYISIFPENVNVTAIVGENGSGKSTLLEFLMNCFIMGYDDYTPNKFILIYKYQKELYIFTDGITINNKKEILSLFSIKEQVSFLLNKGNEHEGHDSLISLVINNEYTELKNRYSEQFFKENTKKSLSDTNKLLIENSFKLKEHLPNFEKVFIPTKIGIKLRKIDDYSSIIDKDRDFYTDEVWEKVIELNSQLKNSTFFKKIEIVKEIFKIKSIHFKLIDEEKLVIFSRKKDTRYFQFEYKNFAENIPDIIKNDTSTDNEFHLNIADIDEKILTFIRELPKEFNIELKDEKRDFNNLSFGERQLLIQMHTILNYLLEESYYTYDFDHEGNETEEKTKIKEFTIFLDEFEIGLHPNWQKKFIQYINELSKFTEKKIHLIITSHSPFLLSDLQKEHIIFLKKGKVKYPFKKNQTFGANIHTLLSNGFFMDDGLMGEFAKEKIDEIKRFYDENKDLKQEDIIFQVKKDEFERKRKSFHHIQSIIGEPFIQTVIKNYLDELEIIFNGKKEFLDKEIQRLQDMRSQL